MQHLEFTVSVAEDKCSGMQCCITGQVVPVVSKDFFFKQFLNYVSFMETSGTTCPVTQCHIPEDANLQY